MAIHLRDQHAFMIITANFERFQYFNFATNFLKIETLFQKTGVPFLVESNKIENTIFLYKTALSEASA